MKISPEYLAERKKNIYALRKWKFLVVALVVVISFVLCSAFGEKSWFTDEDYIARVSIDDIILENKERSERLEQIVKDENIKGVIVYINSPGGSVVGSEILYSLLRKISGSKPTVAVLGSVAASGGYMAAIGTDYIIAHNGTLTGSIGAILQSTEISEVASKIGIKFNTFKSGKMKAVPNFTEKVTDEVTDVVMSSVHDIFGYFIELVKQRRSLSEAQIKEISDGRILSAKAALANGLIDKIGNIDDAVEWIYQKGVPTDLEVKPVNVDHVPSFFEKLIEGASSTILSILSKNLTPKLYMY